MVLLSLIKYSCFKLTCSSGLDDNCFNSSERAFCLAVRVPKVNNLDRAESSFCVTLENVDWSWSSLVSSGRSCLTSVVVACLTCLTVRNHPHSKLEGVEIIVELILGFGSGFSDLVDIAWRILLSEPNIGASFNPTCRGASLSLKVIKQSTL